jgi:DNA-binding CsgD family transcriptional regulator
VNNKPDLTERDLKVLAMWAAGDSGGVISNAMSITRNAVMGIIYRAKHKLALQNKSPIKRAKLTRVQIKITGNTNGKQSRTSRIRRRRPIAPIVMVVTPPPPTPSIDVGSKLSPTVISLLTVTGCRYIDTDTFCNEPVHKRSSWCEHHYKRVFTPFIPRSQRV